MDKRKYPQRKICVYCKTENRAETIFCQHCRRPLPSSPRPPRIAYVWLLMVIGLIGLGSYVFSSPSSVAPAPTSRVLPFGGPAPTSVREPVTILACIEGTTGIRRGPGTQYETVGELPSGTCLTILGRNEEASWVFMVSDDDLSGWVSATVLKDIGDVNRVSVRDNNALVNPARSTLTSEEIANGAQIYLTRVAATNHPGSPLGQYVEPCFEAVNRVGDQITCRMGKAYCDYFPEVEGHPTVCIDRPAPDHIFSLVTFGNDWTEYDGQCLIVSGNLEADRGMLQIQAHDRDQVSPCQ